MVTTEPPLIKKRAAPEEDEGSTAKKLKLAEADTVVDDDEIQIL